MEGDTSLPSCVEKNPGTVPEFFDDPIIRCSSSLVNQNSSDFLLGGGFLGEMRSSLATANLLRFGQSVKWPGGKSIA